MNRYVNTISGRLSLRAPQHKSLEILSKIAGTLSLDKKIDLAAALKIIRSEYPSVTDFERSFPSICFALATGVGKTRLMGAFITYLHLAHGVENFFVLAPNLTIYNKLIVDFTPGTPKYVFKGIAEFAVTSPTLITGDTYNELAGTLFDSLVRCRINVFNISKINSEVRGGNLPKIKQLSEYIGQSYFDFLAGLPDLVMLMDESHRYRATAGIRAINDLKPILGLELTATPFVETSKGAVHFKNVIYNYSLSQAMQDGFVKEPAVVTRKNFSSLGMTPLALEEMKLSDGIALHEKIKVELETYALKTDNKIVKPFLLIIARDTTHAGQLMKKIQSEIFREGNYKAKVIQVDSSTKEEEVITRLLKVEEANEPTEIVIHVNMLKEGWDVTNLYTIVPLRAANARTLIEQSIGRGLRLPYGKRTGVSEVDTLNIIAHDKFQEIVDEARKPGSLIKMKSIELDENNLTKKLATLVSQTILENKLGVNSSLELQKNKEINKSFLFKHPQEIKIAKVAYNIIRSYEGMPEIVPTSSHLKKPKVKKMILDAVLSDQATIQQELELNYTGELNVEEIISKTIDFVLTKTIDIPHILEIPNESMQSGFYSFSLNLTDFQFSEVSNDLWIQELRTGESHFITQTETNIEQNRLEDIIVQGLTEFDDISYEDHADLLYELAKQCISHLIKKFSEEEIRKILKVHQKSIATKIHEQMQEFAWESINDGFEVRITKGFSDLKSSAYTTIVEEDPIDYKISPKDKNNISKYLYGGFNKCLYVVQKFDSNQERILSVILERESEKWFRPASGQFPIYYKSKGVYGQYDPDFVVETKNAIYMIEVKARGEMNDSIVIAKRDAAVRWCMHASNYSSKNGGNPWSYILIPHDTITENKSLLGLINDSEIINTYEIN